MKKTKTCPKCESREIGFLPHQPDLHSKSDTAFKRVAGLRPSEEEAAEVAGFLEAYFCTSCGYYESYLRSPSAIDWETMAGFRWVNPKHDSESPYR